VGVHIKKKCGSIKSRMPRTGYLKRRVGFIKHEMRGDLGAAVSIWVYEGSGGRYEKHFIRVGKRGLLLSFSEMWGGGENVKKVSGTVRKCKYQKGKCWKLHREI